MKPVQHVDACAFVVASQQEKVLWVLDFVGEQKTDGFYGLSPSVHVVPKEKIIGFWRETTVVKEP